MIQRFIYDILRAGIDAVAADPTIIDNIFDDWDLSDTESAAIKQLWVDKPPKVKHQYARSDDQMPLISIVLSGENESDMVIGDEVGMVTDTLDPDFGADISGSIWDHQFQVLIYTEHPDHTLYNYEIVKGLVLISNLVRDCGLHGYQYSGGDLSPAQAYAPEHLFVRHFTIKARREVEVTDVASKLAKAFKVRGIHIAGGSESSVGGVKTLVTPFNPDE